MVSTRLPDTFALPKTTSNHPSPMGVMEDHITPILGRLETILIFNPEALWNDITAKPSTAGGALGAITGGAIGASIGARVSGRSTGGTLGGALVGAGTGFAVGYFGTGLLTSDNLFRFRVNPQTFKQSESKIRNFYKTMRGWETSYGGENMIKLSFTGTTGWMLPPGILRDMGINDIRLSLAYWNLSRFNKFYQDTDRRGTHLKMIFLARVFSGHLIDFDWSWSADDPNQIKYTFSFMVYPDKIKGVTSLFPEWLHGIMNATELTWTLGQQLAGGRGVTGIARGLF